MKLTMDYKELGPRLRGDDNIPGILAAKRAQEAPKRLLSMKGMKGHEGKRGFLGWVE